jgi:hypothetical protein
VCQCNYARVGSYELAVGSLRERVNDKAEEQEKDAECFHIGWVPDFSMLSQINFAALSQSADNSANSEA